jgi:hypothetical protein
MLVVAVLFMGTGNAHAFSDHAGAKAEPCAAHHQAKVSHEDCCCSCLDCPAGVVTPFEVADYRPVALSATLTPAGESVPATRSPSPEIDPPRPCA